ncbi:MAG: hypothetical protein V3T05_01525, partial [Myxococcota bacterium]
MSRISETRSDAIRQTQRSEIAQQTQKAQDKQRAQTTKAGATKPTDGVDQGKQAAAPTMKAATQPGTTTATGGANPFAQLAQRAKGFQMPPRVLAGAVPMDQDVSPDGKAMAKLAGLEQAAAGLADGRGDGVHEAAAKIRQGVMLTLSDSVEAHIGKDEKISRSMVSNISESIVESKDEKAALAAAKNGIFAQKGMFGAGMDVQAYVQAVLRESYLLQNEILKDYADRVKYWNDTKKAIRKKAAAARKYRHALKEALASDGTISLPDPIDFGLLLEEGSTFEPSFQPIDGTTTSGGLVSDDEQKTNTGGDESKTDSGLNIPSEPTAVSTGALESFAHAWPEKVPIELRELLDSLLSNSDNWDAKVKAFRDFIKRFPDGGEGMASGTQALNMIAAAVPELSATEFFSLARFSTEWFKIRGTDGNYNSDVMGYHTTRRLFQLGTAEQLKAYRDGSSDTTWGYFDGANNGMATPHLNEIEDRLSTLPGDWQSDPGLASLALLLVDVLLGKDPHDKAALATLKERMWDLSPEDAKSFFQHLIEEGSCPAPVFDELFFS